MRFSNEACVCTRRNPPITWTAVSLWSMRGAESASHDTTTRRPVCVCTKILSHPSKTDLSLCFLCLHIYVYNIHVDNWTASPTQSPSKEPTESPTSAPSPDPTIAPTESPTITASPTLTYSPTTVSEAPTTTRLKEFLEEVTFLSDTDLTLKTTGRLDASGQPVSAQSSAAAVSVHRSSGTNTAIVLSLLSAVWLCLSL